MQAGSTGTGGIFFLAVFHLVCKIGNELSHDMGESGYPLIARIHLVKRITGEIAQPMVPFLEIRFD